jgi:hypothetical protein
MQLLEAEIRSGKPNSSVLVEGLKSMKVIAEGAEGNLVATGICIHKMDRIHRFAMKACLMISLWRMKLMR